MYPPVDARSGDFYSKPFEAYRLSEFGYMIKMHKFITVSAKNKSVLPYLNTTVPFERTFGEIQGLLMKFGCSDLITRQTPSIVPGTKMSCTLYMIGFVQKGNHFLIEFPIVIVPVGKQQTKEIRMAVSGRIMLNKIKALLVDVEMDFMSFEQAMMPFQLIAGRDGQPTTIQDFVDDHRAELQTGGGNLFRLGDGR